MRSGHVLVQAADIGQARRLDVQRFVLTFQWRHGVDLGDPRLKQGQFSFPFRAIGGDGLEVGKRLAPVGEHRPVFEQGVSTRGPGVAVEQVALLFGRPQQPLVSLTVDGQQIGRHFLQDASGHGAATGHRAAPPFGRH